MKEGIRIQSGLGVGKKLGDREQFEYHPFNSYKKGKLIEKRNEEFSFSKSKSGIREYKEKIEDSVYSSAKDLLDLGFDKYETKPKTENTFLFINEKGDQVILNVVTKEKKVYLKP